MLDELTKKDQIPHKYQLVTIPIINVNVDKLNFI